MLPQGTTCNVFVYMRLRNSSNSHELCREYCCTRCQKPHRVHWVCRECDPGQLHYSRRWAQLASVEWVAGKAAAAASVCAYNRVPTTQRLSALAPCASMGWIRLPQHLCKNRMRAPLA